MLNGIGTLTSVLVAMAILGALGERLAREKGMRPMVGFLLGACLPLVGIGILLIINKKTKAGW